MSKLPPWLQETGHDIWDILRQGLGNIVRWHKWYLVVLCLLVLIARKTCHHDVAWLQQLQTHQEYWTQLARKLSYWGDYLTWTVPFGLLILGLGLIFKKTNWRRAAIACILAASFAGISANIVSFAVGRPRPSAETADGMYGPRWNYNKYRSFPSGHAATSFGTATALAVTLPPVGIPCLFYAGGVGWSRMELGRHYPTDVLVGSVFGIAFGIAFGRAARSA